MTIVFKYDGILLPYQTVRMTGGSGGGVAGLPSSAWYGEPMTAGVRIEDPNGTLDFEGWHTFTVDEPACAKPRIFTGWITGKAIARGPYVTGAGRVWDCDIIDQNALFSLEVFRASSAKRPAETDIVRAAWAIASGPMAGTPIHNNGRANFTDNPINFGDANYVTNYPAELFNSIAATAGKNFYAYWDDAAAQISLHYDLTGVGPASTLRLSNVLSDYDGVTTFAPQIDATLRRSPEDVYTGELFGYRGAYVYARRQATIDSLSPTEFSPTNFLRDVVYQTDRVGKQATAQQLVQDQLEAHATEQDTITCMVQLPNTKVNLLRAGDVVSVKFSHLPGFTTFTDVAVIRRTVVPTPDQDDLYDVHLELSNGAVARGPGGGSPGVFPAQPCQVTLANSDEHDDTANGMVASGMDVATTPTPGNLQVVWVLTRDIATKCTPTGFTAVGPGWQDDPATSGHKAIGNRFFYRFVAVGDTKHIAFTKTGGNDRIYVSVTEWSGPDTFDGLSTWTDGNNVPSGPFVFASASVTPQADRANVFVCAVMPSLNVNDTWFPHQLHNTARDIHKPGEGAGTSAVAKGWVGYQTPPKRAVPLLTYLQVEADPTSSPLRGYSALTLAFSGPCADNPPGAGQPVSEPAPSVGGGKTNFTTSTPYAEGSLQVYVDGIRQPVIETNPATGAFQLYFDPRPSEYVSWDFQARPG